MRVITVSSINTVNDQTFEAYAAEQLNVCTVLEKWTVAKSVSAIGNYMNYDNTTVRPLRDKLLYNVLL